MSDDYLHGASPGHPESHHDSGAATGGENDSNHGNMGPTSAILDQVDEYLNSHRHAGNDSKNGGDEPQENDEHGFISARRNTPWAMDSQHYVTEDIDMDLDNLSHALLSGDRGDDRNTNNGASTDTNTNTMGGVPGGETGKHDSASFLDQDSLSPIDLSGPSPSHFQLDFSLIDENHHHHHHQQQQQQYHQQQQQQQQQQQHHQHSSEHQRQHHHTHSIEPEDTNSNEHVRPDMVFSPMVSPMVMPTNSLHNTPFMGPSGVPYGNVQNTPFMAGNSSSAMPASASKQHGQHQSKFSPLTSPALNAIEQQQQLQQQQQQQQQQQNFSLPESARKSSGTNTRSKRTPHTTPLMGPTQSNQATNTNKIIKHSPHISSRRSISKFKGGSWDDMVFKLPDSSIKNEHAAQGTANNHNHTPNSTHSSSNGSNSDRMTPSSLMNYPKIILPSNSNTMPASTDESVLRATESPVIKPNKYSDNYYKNSASHRQSSVEEQGSNVSGNNAQKHNSQNQSSSIQKQSYTGSSTSNNGPSSKLKKNHSSSSITQVSSPATNTNNNYDSNANSNANANTTSSTSSTKSIGRTRSVPRRSASLRGSSRSSQKAKSSSEDEGIDADAEQGNDLDAEEDDDDDDTVKKQKQVHKVAEQGRRNRLNNALKDLEALIPKELKDVAAIPSKATTVELAAQYIRQLLKSNPNQ